MRGVDGGIFGRPERGQATVEYALVLFAFLAMVAALGVMWHATRDGMLLRRAEESASHASGDELSVGSLQDVLLY